MNPVFALPRPPGAEHRTWGFAAAIALGAHLALGLALLGWTRPATPPLPRLPEPVVLVELPPTTDSTGPALPPPGPAMPATQPAPAQPTPGQALAPTPPAPLASSPLPAAPLNLPGPTLPAPVRQAAPAPAPPAASPPSQAAVPPAGAGNPGARSASADPRARAAEVDYFSLLSAYLNRRKTYPAEARQARAEGVVVVRFTVDRDGAVSATEIKRSSGHAVLDQATLALLQRVAPLPRMPAAMPRQAVTLALPIEYALKTS